MIRGAVHKKCSIPSAQQCHQMNAEGPNAENRLPINGEYIVILSSNGAKTQVRVYLFFNIKIVGNSQINVGSVLLKRFFNVPGPLQTYMHGCATKQSVIVIGCIWENRFKYPGF